MELADLPHGALQEWSACCEMARNKTKCYYGLGLISQKIFRIHPQVDKPVDNS